jgi:hypothetical protein
MRDLIISILFLHFATINDDVFGRTNVFDTSHHFYSIVDKAEFDTLKGADFTWLVFAPINDTLSYTWFHERPAFIEKLSDKQKVLFYIWELDRAVTAGELGFANFYYNYGDYYKETVKGLKLINDTAMTQVLEGVNAVYLSNQKVIDLKLKTGDWKYVARLFKKYNKAFVEKERSTMTLLEKYIRLYPDDFIRFKDN